MTVAQRVRVYSVVVVAVVATLLVANQVVTLTTAQTAAENIRTNMSDVPAYQTTNLGKWHGSLPIARTVTVTTTVDLATNDYAAAYNAEVAGGYVWGTGEIVLTPEANQMVVVHELGHALTYEALVLYCDGDMIEAVRVLFGSVTDFNRTSDVRELPTALRDVATEYKSVPADVYGSTYYTERLTEYLAQSFARHCNGQPVPPVVEAWLAGLENEGR